MNLLRERDRLALAGIERPRNKAGPGAPDFHPGGRVNSPVLHLFRRTWMLEFRKHSRWNKNPRV
jgi:hypothetical protein